MNILSVDEQITIIAALTEGVSIRATERLTGVHRDAIMSLGVRVGQGCARLHDRLFRDLSTQLLQLDEMWYGSASCLNCGEWRRGCGRSWMGLVDEG